MNKLAIWKQAFIYLTLFFGVGSYIKVVADIIKQPFLNATFGIANTNLTPISGGVFLVITLISLIVSVYVASKIATKLFAVSRARNVSLLATALYIIISIVPTLQIYLFTSSQFRDYLLPKINLGMIPVIILPYVLFFFASAYFLKSKN